MVMWWYEVLLVEKLLFLFFGSWGGGGRIWVRAVIKGSVAWTWLPMLVLSFTNRVIPGESLCLCVSTFLPFRPGHGHPGDSPLKALSQRKRAGSMRGPLSRSDAGFLSASIPGAVFMLLALSVGKQMLYCFLSASGRRHIVYNLHSAG